MKESTLRNRLRRRGYHLVSKYDGYGCKNYAILDQIYTTMQKELFDKIETEDFKNFVISIAESN